MSRQPENIATLKRVEGPRETQLAMELADARRLQEISTRLIQEGDVDALYHQILDAAISIMRSEMASMQMFDPERGALRMLAYRGFNQTFGTEFEWVTVDCGTSCAEALRSGKRVVVEDVEMCDFVKGSPSLEGHLQNGILASQSTPLISRSGTLLGMMSTHWRAPHRPEERELRLLDVLARQAADLIERTRNENALRLREQRFRDTFNSISAAVYTCDAQGRITLYNEAAVKLWGRAPEIGKDLWCGSWRIYRPDGTPLPLDDCPMGIAIREGRPVEGAEIIVERPDGVRRHILPHPRPLFDADGTLIGAVNLLVDISDRKQAEEALKSADRRKSEFLAVLAHELRNPLAPIRNALQLIRMTGDDGQTLQSATDLLERQVGQMVRLVDDLLDVSRIDRGKIELRKERIELAFVVNPAVEAALPLCERMGQELIVVLPEHPVYLNADPARLTQVVANLLNNASKFTNTGGRISLSVEREGDSAVIRARDDGIGIARDQIAHIFDMFTQVDSSRERSVSGLGIGLTLVKNLVEMHGGAVEAHSEGLGRGTEFVVRLPVLVEPVKPSPRQSDIETETSIKHRILIVDDDEDSADSLAMLLEMDGHDVCVAYDGLAAVEAAAKFDPGVILLDIGLPRLDGYEAALRIREERGDREVFIVALTGWAQEEDRFRSKQAGFDAHLLKPVEHATLAKLLADLQQRA